MAIWLFLAWVALFGSLRPNVVVGGIAVSGVVAFALRHLAPRWPHALRHPVAALRFAAHFTLQLAAATWDVIRLLARPTHTLRPAVVEVPLLVGTRNEVTLLMNAVSFTPGTVALELHGDRLLIHVLSTKPTQTVVAEIGVLQRLIMDAFGQPPRRRHTYHATDDV
jgi:multicomponent Na+:H+ antiporter subunit E